MKLGIVGSRDFKNFKLLENTILSNFEINEIDIIVSGGAKGADNLAEKFAEKYDIQKMIFKPDWEKYGKKAGFIRNEDIVNNSDFIIAFWDEKSKGTLSTINLIKKLKNMNCCLIIRYKNNSTNFFFD